MSTFVVDCFQRCLLKFANGDRNSKTTENTNNLVDCDSSFFGPMIYLRRVNKQLSFMLVLTLTMINGRILQCQTSVYNQTVPQTISSLLKFNLFNVNI